MQNAWEIQGLIDKLKARGLDIAEDAAKIVIEETIAWVDESVTLSENKIDDVVKVALPMIKEAALNYADKIDGKEG